jgi:hypothetical protein
MIRYLFAFLMLIHGVIHLAGFSKAFGNGYFAKISRNIDVGEGIIWLSATVLFFFATVLFIINKDEWWMCALPAVILSQVLIIINWQDAKAGTILNIIVLLIAIIDFADWQFNRMVKKEVHVLLDQSQQSREIITIGHLGKLPPVVQKWLTHTGIVGKLFLHTARLKQVGMLKLKPDAKWMDFTATQYFNADIAAFNWQVKVDFPPFMYLDGRDKLEDGKGAMLIKLLSLKSVADSKNTETINQGTLLRYLSEICLVPTAALNNNIEWEQVDSLKARATLKINDISVTGEYTFDTNGDIISFEAMRYGEFDGKTSLEKWHIDIKEYAVYAGIRIPSKFEVTWKLRSGDFTWMKMEITGIEYNIHEMY